LQVDLHTLPWGLTKVSLRNANQRNACASSSTHQYISAKQVTSSVMIETFILNVRER
jgi:hypothetical protein